MDHPVNDRSINRLSRRTALAASLGGLAMAGLAGGSNAAGQATPIATPVVTDDASYLFVQAGFASGTLVDNGDGTFLLTLLNAPAQTVYLSDRPDRVAGAMPTERFLEILGFDGGDPPNAALVIQVDDENTDVIVFELTAPVYDADVASLTYIAILLEGFDQFVETGVGFVEEPLTADTLPQEFGSCSLFIDSLLGCSPWDPRC